MDILRLFCKRHGILLSDDDERLDVLQKISKYVDKTLSMDKELAILEEKKISIPNKAVAILGCDMLEMIRSDIGRTTFPSWMKPSPKQFGTVHFGKISAEEWKTIVLVSLIITLCRTWTGAYTGTADMENDLVRRRSEYFNNLVHLSISIRLGQRRLITDTSLDLYDWHIRFYLEGFKVLYPDEDIRPYQHYALHLPDILRRWGPSEICNANPPEFWNEQLQGMNTNHKLKGCKLCSRPGSAISISFPKFLAELEIALAQGFNKAQQFKAMLAYRTMPPGLDGLQPALKDLLSTKYQGVLAKDIPSEHRDPTTSRWTVETVGKSSVLLANEDYDKIVALVSYDPPLRKAVWRCRLAQLGSVRYQPSTVSRNNSRVLFRSKHGIRYVAVIDAIYKEVPDAAGEGRILARLKKYKTLSTSDAAKDPYGNHPILGRVGYDICRLYRDCLAEDSDVVPIEWILTHCCTCPLSDGSYESPVIVSVALDRVCFQHFIQRKRD